MEHITTFPVVLLALICVLLTLYQDTKKKKIRKRMTPKLTPKIF